MNVSSAAVTARQLGAQRHPGDRSSRQSNTTGVASVASRLINDGAEFQQPGEFRSFRNPVGQGGRLAVCSGALPPQQSGRIQRQ
jgi:hypothetical protein